MSDTLLKQSVYSLVNFYINIIIPFNLLNRMNLWLGQLPIDRNSWKCPLFFRRIHHPKDIEDIIEERKTRQYNKNPRQGREQSMEKETKRRVKNYVYFPHFYCFYTLSMVVIFFSSLCMYEYLP